MIAWLLLIYVGGHIGYISVPDIRDETECHALYDRIAATKGTGFMLQWGVYDSCIPYRKAAS
jgi:hypothetical protein